MRGLAVLFCVAVSRAWAQQPVAPNPDSARAESARVPVPPSPDQQRFLDGLRTATRGIAQLKDGLARVARAEATGSAAVQRKAGRFLSGWCGSARAFMRRGRPQMNATAYEDSVRLMARRLVTQVDSLIAYTPTCEQEARATPVPVATDLGKRMKTYDAALRDFRAAIGLPVKEDTVKTTRRPP